MSRLSPTKKVIIVGGGVSGLAVAHRLSAFPQYDIHLYERNTLLGGQAQSEKVDHHTEICWHAVASGYHDFLALVAEIPLEDGYVIDKLKPVSRVVYAGHDVYYEEEGNPFLLEPHKFLESYRKLYGKPVGWKNTARLLWLWAKVQCMCDARARHLDETHWKDYISFIPSPNLRRWLLDSMAIYCGMEYNHMSSHLMIKLIQGGKQSPLVDPQHKFYSFTGNMNELLFKPWAHLLEARGVKIYREAHVDEIAWDGARVTHLVCNGEIHEADHYVCAVDPQSLSTLYPGPRKNMQKLARGGHQLQCQVLYHIPNHTQYYNLDGGANHGTVVVFHDSPWFLMIRVESTFWDIDYDLLSVGIGIWDVPGHLGKCATQCTREELARECWEQIWKSEHNLGVPHELPEWDIWHSYVHVDGAVTTHEPKWSNSTGTLAVRPPPGRDSRVENLYHAGSHCATWTNIYNMESAAEAGCQVAHQIHTGQPLDVATPRDATGWWVRCIRWVDSCLFRSG